MVKLSHFGLEATNCLGACVSQFLLLEVCWSCAIGGGVDGLKP